MRLHLQEALHMFLSLDVHESTILIVRDVTIANRAHHTTLLLGNDDKVSPTRIAVEFAISWVTNAAVIPTTVSACRHPS